MVIGFMFKTQRSIRSARIISSEEGVVAHLMPEADM